jgi:phage baseplate assembly protein gpV
MLMCSQQTKWWLPSAGKQCCVNGDDKSSDPHGCGGWGCADTAPSMQAVARHINTQTPPYGRAICAAQ